MFKVYYYGSNSSGRAEAYAEAAGSRLVIKNDEFQREYPLSEIKFRRGIGSAPSHMFFADGSSCETFETEEVAAILKVLKHDTRETFVLMLERKWRYVLAALAFTMMLGAALFFYGVPLLAKAAAYALPAETNRMISKGTIDMLDKQLFKPSALSSGRRRELDILLMKISEGLPRDLEYKLVFRTGGKLGSNAIALPDGNIIVTDELVHLAKNDNELASVFAHELGHIIHRHGLRTLLQNSVISAAAVFVTGDISSLTVGIPSFLMQAKYSRDFERDADSFAIERMKQLNMPVKSFADMLNRLSGERQGGKIPAYISTHPDTAERVKSIMKEAEKQ
ncbi:M48 family metallopeptidase [Seleniivibrio woodruffii]|uniref:M48 family metallopeptidase n=1 Tax=Seleniivibrio woodruffii TaxID=1078050 RepID=UPI0039E3E4A6